MTMETETVTQTLRVGVVGSRNFPELRLVRRFISELPSACVVVSGGASGVDTAAEEEAEARGLDTDIYEPDIDQYGVPMAYFVRNSEIVENADWIVAFWDGESNGTRDTIKKARKARKPVNIYIR